jgi:Cu-processing system permease protein
MIRPLLLLATAEFQEGWRNRWVLCTVLLLTALAFALALLGSSPIGETRISALNVTTVSLASLSVYLIPLIALTLSYDAIVGEKERGTLLLLLTYPVKRWQVIAGKFLGHLAIIASAVILGYGATGTYLALTGDLQPGDGAMFFSMLASSVILGGVFVALGYLISVTVSSRATAAGIAVACWLFIVVVYDLLLLGLVLSDSAHRISTDLFGTLLLLNPADVYRLFNLAGSSAASLVSGSVGLLEDSILSPALLVLVLCLWVVIPLLISIRVFSRDEL